MEGEQFSLCWNNFHNNLSSGFHSLLKDEDLVDVTLAAEGKYLKAHKTVLSVCSPYFKELFRVNPCKHPIVILQDVKYGALCNLLQFMYQGEVSVSQEEIPVFMRVAEMLKIKGLTDNKSAGTNSNGVESGNSQQSYTTEPKHALKRPKPVKKVVKPNQQQNQNQSRSFSDRSSSGAGRQLASPPPARSPQVKQPKLDDSHNIVTHSNLDNSLLAPILPKQEPLDTSEFYSEIGYDEHMDVASMLDTTLGESSRTLSFTSKGPPDASSPGTLQCVLGKRGIPRLIVDGYTFFKKSSYKQKTFWYCKFNRTQFKCTAVCWTVHGQIVKWPSVHSHEPLNEHFNPDEDTIVPIEEMQRVLIETCET